MSGLVVTDLNVTYPGPPPVRAVVNASLTVEPGEIVALVGPSGCGKSSVLGAIVGIVEPVSGSITWNGRDIGGVPIHERGFGLVFQDGQLFPHRSVGRNIAYGLEVAGMPREERRVRVSELLRLVGLPGLEGRPVHSLSGGERQRVALARSLAPRPRLLALDEPLASLDTSLRRRLASEVRDILRAAGTTAIVVTHDQEEAATMAGRVIRMHSGRILD